MLLENVQILQEAQNHLSTFPQAKFDSTVSKSATDIGRTNVFEMYIPATGPCIVCKPYHIPHKYQKFFNEEIWLLESSGCISKSLSQMGHSSNNHSKETRSPKSRKTTTMFSSRLLLTEQICSPTKHQRLDL